MLEINKIPMDEFAIRHIIPISGKDSLCTAIVQMNQEPDIDYEFLFNPTGSELPEVFEWLDEVETYLGTPIHRIGKSLEKLIETNGYFLPSRQKRYCTIACKIKPMLQYVGSDEAEIYFGLRADEKNRIGFKTSWKNNINANYPLREHGIGLDEVYRIINKVGLKPPTFFWKRLYEEAKYKLGFDPKLVLSEWVFDKLFAWRSRANCYHCFNQRHYEVCGLWEHYPELAEKAAWYEKQGSSKTNYTWLKKPFEWFRDNDATIVAKRVAKIVKYIQTSRQLELFTLDEINNSGNILPITSCGLLCGK